jgi:DNA-directed RNA polymerase specialized sigma24 family protein
MAGLSYEEMAEHLELPLGTVKSRMHQLVERLQKELLPWIAP